MKKKLYIASTVIIIITVAVLGILVYIYNMRKNETSVKYENIINSGETNIDLSGDISGELLSQSGELIQSGESEHSGESVLVLKEEVAGVSDVKNIPDKKIESDKEKSQDLKSNSQYYIKINNLQNVVTVYKKDSVGNYTIPYKAMICSTGEATPVAGKKHKVTSYKQRWNALQGNVYGQYATQIIGNILFHSVPYTAKKNSALEYWEYDKLGTSASLGCIRLTVEDAKWVYDNIPAGTIVEFYEDINPGPLRKTYCTKDIR